MDDKRYKELLSKLNYIDSCMNHISPTQKLSGVSAPDNIFLYKDMNLEQLSQNEKILAHVLLHNFFSRGGIKGLDKESIIDLHKKIVAFIPHNKFDLLDEK